MIENQDIDAKNIGNFEWKDGEFDSCTFVGCDFSEIDLSETLFLDCTFRHCNMSMSKFNKTAFREVVFEQCKMLGANFQHCNAFLMAMTFEECQLNYASFYQLKLKGTRFSNCDLSEVDFIEAELTKAVFTDCNMDLARFENSLLEGADFRTAYNYSIDPELNYISGAKFSKDGVVGLLDKYQLHIEE